MRRLALVALAGLLSFPVMAQAPRTDRAPAPAASAGREIILLNDAGVTLREFYAAPSGSNNLGRDLLGQGTLAADQALRLRLPGDGCTYDLVGIYMDGRREGRSNVDICRDARVVLGDQAVPMRRLKVQNATDNVIFQLFATPPGASDRGPDWLGSGTIRPGQEMEVSFGRNQNCVYDLQIVYSDRTVEMRRNVDVCRTQFAVFGDANAPMVTARIANASGMTLMMLHAVPSGTVGAGAPNSAWGADRLGADVVQPNAAYEMRFRGTTCLYDFRAVYNDRSTEEQANVDVCRGGVVTFTGSTRSQQRRQI